MPDKTATAYPWRDHARLLAAIKQEEKRYGW